MNILLTSVGRRSYLVNYFKEALKGAGQIHVANSTDISPAFAVADKTIVTPLIYSDNYIPFLLEYCQSNAIDIIISLFDIDLPILSKNAYRFNEIGTKVIVSEENVIDICNDKWHTYNFCRENCINVPKTYINLEEAEQDICNGNLSFPLIIKPRWGMGSISIYEAENMEELRVFYKKSKRGLSKSYLKYESNQNIEESILIQEKIDGQEYGLDIINDLEGNYVNTIVKQKYAMRSGETDCAKVIYDDRLKNLGKKISRLTEHKANLDSDIFISGNQIFLLEMNARFGGGYPFSHMAGVNLPLAIIKWVQGEQVEKEILNEETGIMSHKDISIVEIKENSKKCNKLISVKEADVIELVDFIEEKVSPYFSIPIEKKMTEHSIIEYAKKIIDKADGYIYIIDSRIVAIVSGYITNRYKKDCVYISIVGTDAKYRGKGIASTLLDAFVSDVPYGCRICLNVDVENKVAQNFYFAKGFYIVDENDGRLYLELMKGDAD